MYNDIQVISIYLLERAYREEATKNEKRMITEELLRCFFGCKRSVDYYEAGEKRRNAVDRGGT